MPVESLEPEISDPVELFGGYIQMLAEDNGGRSAGISCDRIAHEGTKILLEKYHKLKFERLDRKVFTGKDNVTRMTVSVPTDREKYGELLHEVHKRLKDASVPVGLYVALGREFLRNGMTIEDPSLTRAVVRAGAMANQGSSNLRMFSFVPSRDVPLKTV